MILLSAIFHVSTVSPKIDQALDIKTWIPAKIYFLICLFYQYAQIKLLIEILRY